jgi:antitoxin VapB
MDRFSEIQFKQDLVNQYLRKHHLDGVYLNSVPNFAWFSAGGDSHVENHSKFGVASFLVTKSKRFLLTNNIEMQRILTEQLSGVEERFEPIVYDWFDPEGESKALAQLTEGLEIASDLEREGFRYLGSDFAKMRYQLTPSEVQRSRWLGRNTAEAVETAAQMLRPGMTEYEIEALMSSEITRRGIQPVVLLVAGNERNDKYRHPLPSTNTFTQFAKLVCCARKWGLITALTRCVHVGELPKILEERQEAVAIVDAVFIHNTKPGQVVGDIFKAGVAAYENAGYPDEWQNHHQGGAIGYEARDYIGTLESKETVHSPQTFAWNPSICGNKSEDTILISNVGLEIITVTGQWPQRQVAVGGKTYHRPDILRI